jgi:hypothetical protein
LKAPIHPCGRHQASSSTTGLKWSPIFQVTNHHSLKVSDEIKWQIRKPSRYAMSDVKLSYLSKVEEEAMKFLKERVKHNYLNPTDNLNLDLTVKELEIMISASSKVRGLADSGELEKIYKQCVELENRIEGDYLAVRNHIGKILL